MSEIAVSGQSPQPPPSSASLSPSPAATAATAATAGDAAGRAAAELAQFQDRRFGDDVDPDAPAAMKDSPSVSGDDGAGRHPSAHEVIIMHTYVYTPQH